MDDGFIWQALDKRKEDLSELDKCTQEMADAASDFATLADKLAQKYKHWPETQVQFSSLHYNIFLVQFVWIAVIVIWMLHLHDIHKCVIHM